MHCIQREMRVFMNFRKIKTAVLSGNEKACNSIYYHHNVYRSVKKLCFSLFCAILTAASIICTSSCKRKESRSILQSLAGSVPVPSCLQRACMRLSVPVVVSFCTVISADTGLFKPVCSKSERNLACLSVWTYSWPANDIVRYFMFSEHCASDHSCQYEQESVSGPAQVMSRMLTKAMWDDIWRVGVRKMGPSSFQ